MKVQVKDKQGIDEAGNNHPAPGIEDGAHECELKWQVFSWLSGGDWKDFDVKKYGDPKAFNMQTRQIWVLAEQEKEVKTAEEVFNDYINIRTVGNEVAQNIIDAMVTYASQFKSSTSSTRIAELSARVAELEGVLKEIVERLQRDNYIGASLIATNALKNQQP